MLLLLLLLLLLVVRHTAVFNPETNCAGGRHNMPRPHVTLTFDLLTLKIVSELRVTWATSVAILAFRGLSVLNLGPMYVTDRQTDRR